MPLPRKKIGKDSVVDSFSTLEGAVRMDSVIDTQMSETWADRNYFFCGEPSHYIGASWISSRANLRV